MTQHTPPSTYILRNLVDVEVSEPISYLPQTIGWQVLAVIGFSALLFWLYRTNKKWRHNRYRREAMAIVFDMKKSLQGLASKQDRFVYGQDLFSVMKAVTAHLSYESGSLFGDTFLGTLDTYVAEDAQFEAKWKAWSKALLSRDYALTDFELEELTQDCLNWLAQHRSEPCLN